MIRPLVALLLALAPAAALPAQPGPPWQIQSGPTASRVAESRDRGYAALPASVLVTLGAEVGYGRDTLLVRVGSHQVALVGGTATVVVNGVERVLPHPVYSAGGVVYIPVEFFRQVLVGLTDGSLAVDVAGRSLRGSVPHPPATRAAAPGVVSAAMERTDSNRQPVVVGRPEEVDDEIVEDEDEPAPPAVPSAGATRRRLVVVDAGHGGRDPGARGPGGTREKDVTLAVARRLAALLRQDPTLEVRMTRDRDTLIALRDRARLANRWRGEGQPALFISVHCNANPSRAEKGYETYFLSEARTADAQRVEEFENAAQQYEEAPAAGGALGFILTDLRQNQYLRESSDGARIIQDRLGAIHPGPNRGVKQAGFAVLRGTFMPAVLVEIGFVSNHDEERLLAGGELQADIAAQLARAVRDFFDRPQASARTSPRTGG
jgi:N-acetylmuramoyl-L-alanine amidase